MRKYAVSIMCTLLALSLAVSSFAMSDTDSVYLASADTAAVSLEDYEASEYTPAQLALSIDPVATSSGGVELLSTGLYDYSAAVLYQGSVYEVQWNEGGSEYRVRLYDNSGSSWSYNGTTLADNVFTYGAVLMSVIATDISNNPERAAAFATALTPYLTEAGVGGGATIDEISAYFDTFGSTFFDAVVNYAVLSVSAATNNLGMNYSSDSLFVKFRDTINFAGLYSWTYPRINGRTLSATGFFDGSSPITSATTVDSLWNHLFYAIQNSGLYTLTTPFKPNGFLGITFNGQSAELTADVQDSSLEYILNALYYGDRLQAERWYWNGSTSGTTFTNLSMTDDEAQAYNFRSLGQFLNSEFADVATDFAVTRSHLSDLTGYGSVTSHTVTDEGIETTDTTYDTIIGALTAATNDTNNLLSGLSYIFAAPSDIKLKQDTAAEQQEVTDAVFGDEGIISGDDYGSATDVVSQLGGLADTGVTVSDVAAAVNSSEATSWFSSEVRASLDTTVTTYARGEAPEVHNPFAAGSIYDITTIIGGD